ncbi:uncharacterized protein EV420DRAFT_1620015 [Desarmillaria tabescens]|uniref:FAD-binding PCMH-type domain-containing protein n=1 Tax=Armillaria tabescens TaxID=1929756 RepID=A0AA39KFF9_ARMTA|nr:uncharacterized protein EV420DRAFT_1620015 [Desarmillaria tabescens]KAK0460120.1 hypothetical protein EV420DRAFT_1620015 [Desarmillaria tabescens]
MLCEKNRFLVLCLPPYNTFDGPGFPACNAVSQIYRPSTVDEMINIIKNASANGIPVRASGVNDTMCSDDPNTIIIKTDAVNGISNLQLTDGIGSVVVEAGVTFPQLAEWLHERGAALGYTLVNWNITIAGAVAMGAHRSSLREDSQVSSAAGDLVHLERDQTNDTWLAATTSLGLLGVIARVEIAVVSDYKVYANQTILDEDDVLNGDIYAQISPYVTANYWGCFHLRTYGSFHFQSTFSLTDIEASSRLSYSMPVKNLSLPNFFSESVLYRHLDSSELPWWVVIVARIVTAADLLLEKTYDVPLFSWPVYGNSLRSNQLLKRVRELFDQSAADGKAVTSTYRSFLGQTTERVGEVPGDWSKGAIMFDFPTFRPTLGDHHRYNEEWWTNSSRPIFPVRPHWTKNTRSIFEQSLKNLDQDSLSRFAAVRKQFDPNGTFKSVVGEIIGVM